MDRRRLGALGEREAERYLKERGAKILERNLRCPWGEIDLIARMEGFLCFIEVKSRSTAAYGAPAWGVDRAKRRRILRTAQWYLRGKGLENQRVRFDVVEVTPQGVRHLQLSWTLGGCPSIPGGGICFFSPPNARG